MKELTNEQIANEIRGNFDKRKEECVKLESKLTEALDMINLMYKVEDVDTPLENGLPRVSVSALAHNALLWYPKQAVRAILEEFIPLYDSLLSFHKPRTPLRYILVHLPKGVFDVVAHIIPSEPRLVLRRYRTIIKLCSNLHTLKAMLNDEIDGKSVDLARLSDVVAFAEIVAPERASKNIEWIHSLYKEMKRINHSQIVGFAKLAEKKKK